MPKGVEDGILKGRYKFRSGKVRKLPRIQLLGSGPILKEVLSAADILEKDWNLDVDVWSVTSFRGLRKDAEDVNRLDTLHPNKEYQVPFVTKCLEHAKGPLWQCRIM